MSRSSLGAIVALILLASSAPVLATDGPFAFTAPTLVDPTDSSGEPSLAISDQGIIYVSTLSIAHDTVHVSVDGGATFAPLHAPNAGFGGGDDALAVDHALGVYLVGQSNTVGCQSLLASRDAGVTWTMTLAPCDGGAALYAGTPLGAHSDRPWIATMHTDPLTLPTVMMVHHTPCCQGTHRAVVSHDGGLTFARAGVITQSGWFPGNLVADEANHRFYYFGSGQPGGTAVHAAWSDDDGATWNDHVVGYAGDGGLDHVTGAVDRAGNAYVVASRDGQIVMWSSTDGDAWSGPIVVSGPAAQTNIFPWIVAGDAGRIDVAWYGTTTSGDPTSMPASAAWDVHFAQSLDRGASWTREKVTPQPIHYGRLCTWGAICPSGTRHLLDFFVMDLDPKGYANLVYAQDTNYPALAKIWVTVNSFQRQTSGPSLYAP